MNNQTQLIQPDLERRCYERTETSTGVWVCIRPEHTNNQPNRHSFVKEERVGLGPA